MNRISTLILLSSWYPEPSFYRIGFFQPHLSGFDRVLPGEISSRISFGDIFWISFLSKNKFMKRSPIVCRNDAQLKQKLKSALFYKGDLKARNNIEWEGYKYGSFILFRFLNHIKALQKSAIISSREFSINHYLKTQLNKKKKTLKSWGKF